jgi:predicted lactoylglutathione lyase
MPTQIFVNLPVKSLEATMGFFTKLGFTFNSAFTNENATCMIVSDDIYVMLLVEPFFKTFTKKDIADARQTTEVLLALSKDNKDQVTEMVNKAVEAGGRLYNEPKDHGFMYQHSFEDLDGHQWEIFWMDPAHIPAQS